MSAIFQFTRTRHAEHQLWTTSATLGEFPIIDAVKRSRTFRTDLKV